MSRRVAAVLAILTALFVARVAGQALVAFAGVSWLPSMDAWYSGLLPYRLLLPVQIFIVAVQLTIDGQVWRASGFFSAPRPRLGRALRGISYVYALAMLARWLIWRTHAIPIAFHWVLAAYVFTLGWHLTRTPGPFTLPSRTTGASPRPCSSLRFGAGASARPGAGNGDRPRCRRAPCRA